MKKHYHLRQFAVSLSILVCTFFPTFQASAQGTYKVRFVFDGVTSMEASEFKNMQLYFSADERLISYKEPSQQQDLSYMPSAAEVGFKYSKAKTSSSFMGNLCATTEFSFTNSSSNKVYYRYYSPHFTDVQTGYAELIEGEHNMVKLHPFEGKKIVKLNNVKGRDGQIMKKDYVFFANADKAIYSHGSGRICNGIKYGGEATYNIYADKGSTLHYAIKPSDSDCALAVRTLYVTNDDTEQTIDIDYSKAKKLRIFVADSKGNYIKMDNPSLANTYYADGSSNYGWGTLYGGMFLDKEVKESADGSYNWIETYALPGSKQNFEICNVYSWTTSDPDFLFPYNCPTPFLVTEVNVTDDAEPQDVVLGKSDPRDVEFRLKGAAPLANVIDLQAKAFYHFKWYPFPEDRQWDLARSKEISRQVDGNDLIIHLKVSGVAPHLSIEPKVKSGLEYNDILWKADAVAYKEEFDLPKEGTYTNQTVMDYSKVHAVQFVARHGFLKSNMVALHADCFEYDNSFTHCIEGHKTDDAAIDTITVYLAEGDYEWYTLSSSTGITTSKKNAFHVGADAPKSIIVDAVLSGISSTKVSESNTQIESIFTLEGKRLSTPQRGINLIRMTDGTVVKVKK